MIVRLILALAAAKLAMYLSRLTGRGRGSSLPGMLALRIYPGLLKHYRGQPRRGVIMTTGTNGKTTTSNMLADILEHAGLRVVSNREGANLITGVAAAFIKSGTLTARLNCDYAVLEVDEASFPVVTRWIKPDRVIVTNFFRDQLDRYGELDTTICKVQDALKKLPGGTVLVLNADDPLVARLARETGKSALFYGVRPDAVLAGAAAYSREAKFCPFCGDTLVYSVYLYSQLGDFRCPQCGFARPLPDMEAINVNIDTTGTRAIVRGNGSNKGIWPVSLPVQGIYNIYNGLGAFTTALSLGVAPEKALDSLAKYTPATGRMELFYYDQKPVTLTLVKNPTGFNQALTGLLSQRVRQDVMIAINDNDADGRDISWLWDVDFEVLVKHLEQFNRFICSGQRAEEMALRLKYAGVPPALMTVEKDYRRAVDMALHEEGAAVGMLVTYTALWPVEKILGQRAERVSSHADRVPSVS
ncbi:MurT ligase domain-containing protein [Desulfallas thermosapovorans]|uniref:Lipid II isoglutaminyl synthase (glutamine-hydrolyzing) subunit MurT n=1 Tax=Desulfallas thermosapovorans DSM 6562 TaxID=1121431 RepID=A0A5S4ZYU0_9FIRM|nr:MurT ligase domain-containing protein [Desulfallas thermosapovorans]TYO97926.1 UDP-N-acetylmuramyl tripeptide synthase [Desulfallas thermosapovorans DSM 6562]